MYVAVCVLYAGMCGLSGAFAADQPRSPQVASQPIRPLAKELDAMFNRGEYRAKSVQFAWQNEGEIYTILEPSPKGKGTDIVGYDTATGKRTVLVTAAQLTPPAKSGAAGRTASGRWLLLVGRPQKTAHFYQHPTRVAGEYARRLLGLR